jgi:tetratricopeptide (TPR) repeat protein
MRLDELEARYKEALAQGAEARGLEVLLRVRDHLRAKRYQEALALLEREKEALSPWVFPEELARGIRGLEENPEAFLDHPFLGAEAWNLLGLRLLEDQEKAEAAFREALARDRGHLRALVNLGNLHLERGEVEEAIRLYQEALRLDPEFPQAHHNLAAAYRRKGQLDKAVFHLKRSQRLLMRPSEGGGAGKRVPFWVWLLLLAALLYLLRPKP